MKRIGLLIGLEVAAYLLWLHPEWVVEGARAYVARVRRQWARAELFNGRLLVEEC